MYITLHDIVGASIPGNTLSSNLKWTFSLHHNVISASNNLTSSNLYFIGLHSTHSKQSLNSQECLRDALHPLLPG